MQGKPLLLFGDCFTTSYLFGQGEGVAAGQFRGELHTFGDINNKAYSENEMSNFR
jgi:hypothetical protein